MMFSLSRYSLPIHLILAFALLALSADVSAQTPATPEKAIIAVPSPALSMLPVFFAQDRGLFKKEAIEPVIVSMSGRLQALALGAGKIDDAITQN